MQLATPNIAFSNVHIYYNIYSTPPLRLSTAFDDRFKRHLIRYGDLGTTVCTTEISDYSNKLSSPQD